MDVGWPTGFSLVLSLSKDERGLVVSLSNHERVEAE